MARQLVRLKQMKKRREGSVNIYIEHGCVAGNTKALLQKPFSFHNNSRGHEFLPFYKYGNRISNSLSQSL